MPSTPAPDYAELHCISNFSFLRGASRPEELVDAAATLGYTALAITDECSMAGMVRAHARAKELDFKLIVGSEFALDDGYRLIALVRDAGAYTPGNFWRTWAEGSRRLGTPVNDIRPRNIGANGLIFDPAIDPLVRPLYWTAGGGLVGAGGYGVYEIFNGDE